MGIRYITGRVGLLEGQLLEDLSARLAQDEATLHIIVPKHLTLEMELKLVGAIAPEGSFRLQVLSFERLSHRVFECAGKPQRTMVDDQGRVMLMMRALGELGDELKLYGGAQGRPGFAEKCVQQLEAFRQAGLTPERLLQQAEKQQGSVYERKLRDFSLLLNAYEGVMGDTFADGVVQFAELCARMPQAEFVRDGEFFLYGFDMMPPALHRVIAALTDASRGVHLYLPLENDGDARDFDSFIPLQRSYERLQKLILEQGSVYTRHRLEAQPEEDAPQDIRHLQRELFAYPAQKYDAPAQHVALGSMTAPVDEAMYAAALTRRMVMEHGWHYSDVAFFAPNIADYESELAEACRLYDVPVVLAESRPANRHPLVRCITSTLRWIDSGYRTEDAPLILGSGMFPLTDEEADAFANFCVVQGIRGYQLRRPLRPRKDLDVTEMEALRKKWMQPVLDLEDRLKQAENLPAQLVAVYDFLTDIGAYERCLAQQEQLIALDHRQTAAEDAQVWNSLMASLDQMHMLMGTETMDLRLMADMIDQALGATVIRTLPQSADAVSAQSLSRTPYHTVKLAVFMGLTDRTASDMQALMTEQEVVRLSKDADAWMGLTGADQSRVNRFYLKNAVEQVRCHAVFLWPLASADDSAMRMGPAAAAVRKLFDQPLIVGGVQPSDAEMTMRYSAVPAARQLLAERIGDDRLADPLEGQAGAALWALSEQQDARALTQLAASAGRAVKSEDVPGDVSRRMYGALGRASISRLEMYARCPFQHFVRYGLRPETPEPPEVDERTEGDFYHEAVKMYLDAPGMDDPAAMEKMDRLTDVLVGQMFPEDRFGESAVVQHHIRTMRSTARSAARELARQLQESRFVPTMLEVRFGDSEPRLVLHPAGGDTVLDGRIDRVDEWKDSNVHYLRVIDYKRGNRDLMLGEVYFALQLQLIVYLAAAMQRTGGLSAGAYYFRIADPLLVTDERSPEKVDKLRSDKMRLRGLLPEDMARVRAMAADPEAVFAIKLNNDGSVRGDAPQVNDEELAALIDHVLGEAERIVGEIRSGRTDIAPALSPKTNGCQFCRYKAICQKDAKLPGGDARRIPGLKNADVLELLRKGLRDETKG